MRKPTNWFLTKFDTNQAKQLQKMARGLKFRIEKVEGLYYLCSETKALISFAVTAKLFFCFFSHMQLQSVGFLMMRLKYIIME